MSKLKENKINFTKNTLLNLPLPDEGRIGYYYDKHVNGLGIMVFASSTRTFFLYKRVMGRPDKIKLGRFPQMTVEQARKAAYQMIGEIDKGSNPKADKQAKYKEIQLSCLFNEFIERHAKLHNKSWKVNVNQFQLYLSHLANRRISAITKADVMDLQAAIAKNSGIYAANRAIALLSGVFNKGISWGWKGINPCIGVKKFKEKSRDRFLQADEFSKFFQSLAEEVNTIARDFILVSLLTGARKNNVLSMRWKEVSLENRTWRIPETKSGEALTIPLMHEAIQILKQRQNENKEKSFGNSEFVFPGIGSHGYLADPKKAWKRILKRANIEDFRIHDLRRTMGSWQAATGATTVIIGKSLGHKSQQATAIYARLNLDPVRGSMEKATEAMYKNVNNLLKGK